MSTSGSWQATLAELIDELPRHDGPHGEPARAYVAVDFRGHPDLLEQLLRVDGVMLGSVWARTGLDVYADVAPMIIELDRASQEALRGERASESHTVLSLVLHTLHQRDGGRYAMLAFASTAPLDVLIAHFGHFCDYALPDGREFFVHWYDSRILVRALQVWNDDQRAGFLAPIIALSCAARWQLRAHTGRGKGNDHASLDHPATDARPASAFLRPGLSRQARRATTASICRAAAR